MTMSPFRPIYMASKDIDEVIDDIKDVQMEIQRLIRMLKLRLVDRLGTIEWLMQILDMLDSIEADLEDVYYMVADIDGYCLEFCAEHARYR